MILDISTRVLRIPAVRPLLNAALRIEAFYYVLVSVRDDEGAEGESFLFALDAGHARILDAAVKAMGKRAIGRDTSDIEAIWQDGRKSSSFLGNSGVTVMALAGIDGALWDLKGKREGLSISSLLGRVRDTVPVYASDGLWVGDTLETLLAQADSFIEAGFPAMKMRLRGDTDFDLSRIAAVRKAIGERELMVDANQAMDGEEAVHLGYALADHNILWFEEPLPAHELEGLARLAREIETPIAAGESLFTAHEFARLADLEAAQYLMPDLQRAGGVSEFVRIGTLAATKGLPVSSHLFPEYSMQLLAHLPTAHSLEYVSWSAPLFREKLEIKDGAALAPDRPGWGFTFDPEAIARYAV